MLPPRMPRLSEMGPESPLFNLPVMRPHTRLNFGFCFQKSDPVPPREKFF